MIYCGFLWGCAVNSDGAILQRGEGVSDLPRNLCAAVLLSCSQTLCHLLQLFFDLGARHALRELATPPGILLVLGQAFPTPQLWHSLPQGPPSDACGPSAEKPGRPLPPRAPTARNPAMR